MAARHWTTVGAQDAWGTNTAPQGCSAPLPMRSVAPGVTAASWRSGALAATALACGLTLVACGSAKIGQLEAYRDRIAARPPGAIEPLPAFRPPTTFLYEPQERRDPFVMDLESEEVAVRRQPSGLAPDPLRRKEELEQYPLDALRMVGTLRQEDTMWALVKTKDGRLHRVGVGNYLGKNNGQITLISEDEIQLTEIVPDGAGDWRERQSAIALESSS